MWELLISIHEAFADLDLHRPRMIISLGNFNPRGLRRPRQKRDGVEIALSLFQSTRPSQTSTLRVRLLVPHVHISIHEAFADLDASITGIGESLKDFNPRGLRRPRRCPLRISWMGIPISIHEAFADLDTGQWERGYNQTISIHEAFADLDDYQ